MASDAPPDASVEAPADASLRRTPLHPVHVELGARLVPFGGWDMPVQYGTGVLAEHHAVRERAGLFDIGHMGQIGVEGPDALELIQWVSTHDAARLDVGAAQYSLLCDERGGVIDDIIVYRMAETRYLIIVNAGNADEDWAWIERQHASPGRGVRPERVLLQRLSPPRTLLALQGPESVAVLSRLTDADVAGLANYHALETTVAGVPAMVARTGYTGERGFEIAFDQRSARDVWDAILSAGQERGVIPCGLGARDTLRLEAGMALYGHELTRDVDPYQAGLDRVVRHEKGEFVGAAALRALRDSGPKRRLVGIELVDRGVLRAEYPIVIEGQRVGELTSGGPSPTLKKSIGMGYVPSERAVEGAPLEIEIRGRTHAAKIVPLPFYRRVRKKT